MSNIQAIPETMGQIRKINCVYLVRTQPQLRNATKENATRFAMGPISSVIVAAIGVVAVVVVRIVAVVVVRVVAVVLVKGLSILQVSTVGGRQLISRLSGLLCA
jgi:hypothetical protein